MKFIALTKQQYVIVDDKDWSGLVRYNWCTNIGNYAVRSSYKKAIFMHNQIMDTPKGMVIDHINGNRLDNRRENLRICTQQQNTFNKPIQKSPKSSKYKGVHFEKAINKWRAYIMHDRKRIHLGVFQDEIDAAIAYDNKAKALFGEFARVNFKEIEPSTT